MIDRDHDEDPASHTSQHNALFDDGGPLADPLERQTIFAALDSFHQYRKHAHYNTTHRRRQNLYALPSAQWQMLAGPPFSILDTLNAVDDALDHNADLADEILRLGLASFGLSENPSEDSELNWRDAARPSDMSKAHSTIRQFYRDWSREGYSFEVEPLFHTILSDLESCLPEVHPDATSPTLLLPGAGLGRILFELCLRGYNVTGNEISYHQLLASNFVLNSTQRANQYSIYPFVNTFTNVTSRAHQLKRHTIPDIHPGSALLSRVETGLSVGEMNMTAGDLVLSYSTPECSGTFDGVVSVFFIDTAPNLIRYIETIRNCLRKGGMWINVGPLLWHFDDRVHASGEGADGEERQDHTDNHIGATHKLGLEDKGVAEPGSFELSDEEVLQLVSRMGFEIVCHEILGEGILDSDPRSPYRYGLGYMQDPASLLQHRYRCSHWVAKKS
ncbi:uncharacterized protein Z518_03646 [Rhinocladiella mackenziei CBS 650.93]|uniref:carnosine N-methyltransferase n=1 Tax=Rhinocladiella mackenziei CBS 650.93 TaxID=1442369 RepID=A0A0D2IIU7_9EURO|nr:uncharacterized protein Z518_03646 [Rhinocladiella mackenziei CBS 650.93]KIX05674.1 hypothetical protein Z518_03646 [Rhinocladiella mackenziei CBS 650.93]